MHRLDRDCSGILVMGRTQLSATTLHSIFREKTLEASEYVGNFSYLSFVFVLCLLTCILASFVLHGS